MTVTRIWLADGEVDVTGVGYDPAGHFESNGHREDYRQRPDLLALLESMSQAKAVSRTSMEKEGAEACISIPIFSKKSSRA